MLLLLNNTSGLNHDRNKQSLSLRKDIYILCINIVNIFTANHIHMYLHNNFQEPFKRPLINCITLNSLSPKAMELRESQCIYTYVYLS